MMEIQFDARMGHQFDPSITDSADSDRSTSEALHP